jgi:pimeloyl-ACP methyl ester carboxylesterase
MYWESRGEGGTPLVVVHGGFGMASMFGDLLDEFARDRRVVALELQGHGHTRDIDRPFTHEAFGDDIAAAIEGLGLGEVDLLGYSVGAGSVLRCAIQHPDLVRRLAVACFPHRRDGWYPEIRAAFDQMGRAQFEMLRQSPMYAAWRQVAPDPEAFPTLIDKIGELNRRDYDWSKEIRALDMPTLLVYGDADSIPPAEAAAFHALLGGGRRDAGWDSSQIGSARLAILPGVTHYDAFASPDLLRAVSAFIA